MGWFCLSAGSQISGDESIWDLTEFFVVRGQRRLGIGKKVAHEVLRKFPGRWEVRVMDRNPAAQAFWERATAAFMEKTIEPIAFDRDGEGWHVLAFESKFTEETNQL